VSTAILIFTKTGHGGTDKVWFYDMKADGYSLDDKRSETKENDIPDIIARFHSLPLEGKVSAEPTDEVYNESARPRTEQSFFVPREEIIANDYDLSINKYKQTEYVAVEYPPTSEIMAKLDELEMEIGAEMEKLRELLGL
jgi:type I restriction enzyme M protein